MSKAKWLALCPCLLSLAGILLAGCAAPGAPIAREPAVPEGITDLSAQQIGDSVWLRFTLPQRTVQGPPLNGPPEIEIYREFSPLGGAGGGNARPRAPQQWIQTIPSREVANYRQGDRVNYPDRIPAADLEAHAGHEAVYMVRTGISRRPSADSNLAEARIFPPQPPVPGLHAKITASSIELSWMPPYASEPGAPRPISVRYRIYRAGAGPGAASAARQPSAKNAARFVLLAETKAPSFRDAHFTFGEKYTYVVRTVAQYGYGSVESEGTPPLEVTPRDTFPPAEPKGLVGAVVPASDRTPAHVDLSWAISSETDLAGYNVYRSSGPGSSWSKVNNRLLLTPTFRDTSGLPGQHYSYRVTAVDRSGNESAPSASISIAIPGRTEQERP